MPEYEIRATDGWSSPEAEFGPADDVGDAYELRLDDELIAHLVRSGDEWRLEQRGPYALPEQTWPAVSEDELARLATDWLLEWWESA